MGKQWSENSFERVCCSFGKSVSGSGLVWFGFPFWFGYFRVDVGSYQPKKPRPYHHHQQHIYIDILHVFLILSSLLTFLAKAMNGSLVRPSFTSSYVFISAYFSHFRLKKIVKKSILTDLL